MRNNCNFVYMPLLFRPGYLTPPTFPLGSTSNYVVGFVGRRVIEVVKGVWGEGNEMASDISRCSHHEVPRAWSQSNPSAIASPLTGTLYSKTVACLQLQSQLLPPSWGGGDFCLKSEKALFDVQQGFSCATEFVMAAVLQKALLSCGRCDLRRQRLTHNAQSLLTSRHLLPAKKI